MRIKTNFKIPEWLSSRYAVIAALVVLVGVAGYFNIRSATPDEGLAVISRSAKPTAGASISPAQATPTPAKAKVTAAPAGFFDEYRADKQKTREAEIRMLDELLGSKDTTAQARREAEEQKLDLIERMEKETTGEGVLKAKGFKDVIVTVGDDSVNVIIKAEKLTEPQATTVMELIIRETGEDPKDIKIIPTA